MEITSQMKAEIIPAPRFSVRSGYYRMRTQAMRAYHFMSRNSVVSEDCWQYHISLFAVTMLLLNALVLIVSDLMQYLG